MKIRTRKNSVLGHFSCSEYFGYSCKCGNLSAEISFWFLDLHYHMLQNMSCDKNCSVCRSNDGKQTHQSVSASFVFKLMKVSQHLTLKLHLQVDFKIFPSVCFARNETRKRFTKLIRSLKWKLSLWVQSNFSNCFKGV